MEVSTVKSALEDLLKAHRLQWEGPPLRGQRRLSPLSTGMASLDALLGGGFPRGQVSEVHGPASSGRTGLAFSTVGSALRAGALAAWVDPSDRFDPCSASESGLALSRLLWLRGGPTADASRLASLRLRSRMSKYASLGAPRDPGASAVGMTAALPAAVSATGTLLGSGLFELVVLDLAGLPSREAGRLSHSTWLRLQRTVEAGPGALLLLASGHVAHGPGGVSLALAPARARWVGSGPGRLLRGLDADARSVQGRMRAARFELDAFV